MALNPETLRGQISEAEEQIAQGEQAKRVLPYLRQALQAMEGHEKTTKTQAKAVGKAKARTGTGAQVNFQPKYGKSAGELGEEVLRRAGRMSLRQLLNVLASEGKNFSDQAVVLGLKKRPGVRRVPAPEESKAKWEYEAVNGD